MPVRLATNFKLSIVSRFLNKHSRIHSDDSLDAVDQQWKVMNNPQRNNSLKETIVNPVMYSPNLNNIKSTSIARCFNDSTFQIFTFSPNNC